MSAPASSLQTRAQASTPASAVEAEPADGGMQVFELAAELFRVLSSPVRLRIVSALCQGELSVGQLLQRVPATQPNMSQHLSVLYRAGVLARRRDGTQIVYRIGHASASAICRSVCVSVASDAAER